MWSEVEFGITTPGISLVLMPDGTPHCLQGNQLWENLTRRPVWHLTVAFRRILLSGIYKSIIHLKVTSSSEYICNRGIQWLTVNENLGHWSTILEFELIRIVPADQNQTVLFVTFYGFPQWEVHIKNTLEIEFHSHYCFNYGSTASPLSIFGIHIKGI